MNCDHEILSNHEINVDACINVECDCMWKFYLKDRNFPFIENIYKACCNCIKSNVYVKPIYRFYNNTYKNMVFFK